MSQEAFVQFLVGQQQNQLSLDLTESHIGCLLHLLVEEDDKDDIPGGYILFDVFIEYVKTYMKKAIIMEQSKSLGIFYDILSRETVTFLFAIRSSLMVDNNINENSGDEDEMMNNSGKKQKSVPI